MADHREQSKAMAEAKKQTLGRQQIECKITENEAAREVTFSKYRQGLFREASELATLCGAEVAIITYPPHGSPSAFGHPSVDAVLNRYISGEAGAQASEAAATPSIRALDERKKQSQDAVSDVEEARSIEIEAGKRRVAGDSYGQTGAGAQASEAAAATPSISALDEQQYQDVVLDLEEVRRIEIETEKRRVAGDSYGQMWWNKEIDDDIGVEELEYYVASLEKLMNMVADKINVVPGK